MLPPSLACVSVKGFPGPTIDPCSPGRDVSSFDSSAQHDGERCHSDHQPPRRHPPGQSHGEVSHQLVFVRVGTAHHLRRSGVEGYFNSNLGGTLLSANSITCINFDQQAAQSDPVDLYDAVLRVDADVPGLGTGSVRLSHAQLSPEETSPCILWDAVPQPVAQSRRL